MRAEVDADSPRSRPLSRADMPQFSPVGRADDPLSAGVDDQAEWARQEQQVCARVHFVVLWRTDPRIQMIMRQQEQTIDTIAGTLSTIQEQAGLMGQEINEHNESVWLFGSFPAWSHSIVLGCWATWSRTSIERTLS